jgi:cytochrome c oxidase subunit III
VSLTVAYAALATGVVIWLVLVFKLSAKPWQAHVGAEASAAEPVRWPPARIGLWLFLAVITSLFSLFVSAYFMRKGEHVHAHGAVFDWVAFPDPSVLWLNTAVLVLASISLQLARTSVAKGDAARTRDTLLIGGLLTLVFLGGQLFAWSQVHASSYFTPANPAIAFFYLLTAVHGLHLLGGMYVWGRTMRRMRRKGSELIDVRLSVELCSVYWHYLLLVWLGLFAVLLST